MAKQTQKQVETLAELKDAVASVVEPDIEGMFYALRKAKTLDDFKEAFVELYEFVECLQSDLQDIQGAIEDTEYDDEEPTENDDGECA